MINEQRYLCVWPQMVCDALEEMMYAGLHEFFLLN